VFDYRRLRDVAIEETERGHVNLLETLAGRIAQRLLAWPQVGRVVVAMDKPGIFDDCDAVGIEVDIAKHR
jgi:dihydroneopterin aldolase